MEEIHKLRAQISNIVNMSFPETENEFAPKLKPPSDLQLKVLRQLLTAGFIDQVAARKDLVSKETSSGTKYSTSRGVPYRIAGISEDVFIHPSSVLVDALPPDYLVFSEVVRTSKLWIKGLTVVNPAWLSSLGKTSSMCTFSKPTKNSAGVLMAIPRFGPEGWELPPVRWEQK
jgi:ATP-dependent RNA helicase DHX37/DHR1